MANRRSPGPLAAHYLALPGGTDIGDCRWICRTHSSGAFHGFQMTRRRPLTMLAAGEAFYAGALARITRLMIVLAVVSSGAAWWKYGWRVALGFVCGCAVAYLNFHWLKKVVAALADRATETMRRGRTAAIQCGDGVALLASLRFDGPRSLCYIHSFSRESLRAFCRPVPARSGHRVRSRL